MAEVTLEMLGELMQRMLGEVRDLRGEIAELREDMRVTRHRLVRIEDRFDSVDETLLRMMQDNRDFNKRLRAVEG